LQKSGNPQPFHTVPRPSRARYARSGINSAIDLLTAAPVVFEAGG
jgi:hypothetical protein